MSPQFIGVDIVRIERFFAWSTYSEEKLRRVLSQREIEKAKTKGDQQAAFFAGRFAAREALYKALSQYCLQTQRPPFAFATLAPCIAIINEATWGLPELHLDRKVFFTKTGTYLPALTTSISIAHEGEYAVATVLLTIVD